MLSFTGGAWGWEGPPRSRIAGAIALGLAALTRPELVLLLPLALLDRWLVAGVQGRPGDRFQEGFRRSFPDVIAGAFLVAIYVVYNHSAGGPLWQQPEAALRAQPPLAWTKLVLGALWASHPLVLLAAVPGFFVAFLAPTRWRAEAPTFLLILIPLALLILPGWHWRQMADSNATYAATYLAPVIAILATVGLFLLYRVAQGHRSSPAKAARMVFALGLAAVLVAVFGMTLVKHREAWNRHEEQVKQEFDLNVCLGLRASHLLASDASIAAREVGAISFFSNRRVIDLGGSVSPDGMRALRSASSPDAGLLTYLYDQKPSHLAIRPGDFPYLTKRPHLLKLVLPFSHNNKVTGGTTNLMLYETPWRPPSFRVLGPQIE